MNPQLQTESNAESGTTLIWQQHTDISTSTITNEKWQEICDSCENCHLYFLKHDGSDGDLSL